MKKGILAGSFDPITNGHVWLIQKAADMIAAMDGQLIVVIGHNPAKKYLFSKDERFSQVSNVLKNNLPAELFNRIKIQVVSNDFLISHAQNEHASFIIRGIRNSEDFQYENQLLQINRKIDSSIETVFFITPPDMSEVSSSTVKGLVGFNNWEQIVSQYVDPVIIDAFRKKI